VSIATASASKRAGFTLLETVVSLAIGMLVMGAAVTANRAVQMRAGMLDVRVEQEMIANEAIQLLVATHQTLRSQNPAQQLAAAFSNLEEGSTLQVAPYRQRPGYQISGIDGGSDIHIRWCSEGQAGGCADQVSYVGPSASCLSTNFTMQQALSADACLGFEYIALAKPKKNGDVLTVQPALYDFTYLPAIGSVNQTVLRPSDLGQIDNYNFYARKITINRRSAGGETYPGYVAVVSVLPVVNGLPLPGEALTRTVTLADWSTSLLTPGLPSAGAGSGAGSGSGSGSESGSGSGGSTGSQSLPDPN
jgi:type II secretory pathway component PulJ